MAYPTGVYGKVTGFYILNFIILFFLIYAFYTENKLGVRKKITTMKGCGGWGFNRVTRLADVQFGAPPFYGFSLGIDPDARECRRQ